MLVRAECGNSMAREAEASPLCPNPQPGDPPGAGKRWKNRPPLFRIKPEKRAGREREREREREMVMVMEKVTRHLLTGDRTLDLWT